MNRVRRAFVMASVEQYLSLIINFVLVATLSRLLTPAEIGIAVVGLGVCVITFSLREFFTAEFLVQRPTVNAEEVQTSGTVLICACVMLGVGLMLAAPMLSRFYGEEGLQLFLAVMILATVIDTMSYPAVALLHRELDFGNTARIRVASIVAMAITTISLAAMGFGFMSYAWGNLVAACATTLMTSFIHPDALPTKPTVSAWRVVLDFGRFRGAAGIVDKIYEAIPQLVLGRFMPMSDVGLYSRMNAISGIPDKMLLSSVFSIAFPALAGGVRNGRDVKRAYLHALRLICVIYWPALLLMALLARPVVNLILGPAWMEVVPLVRIVAVAGIFFFPVILTHPLLMATGKNKTAFVSNLTAKSSAAVILCSASMFGLTAMAWSQFVALPLQMIIALHYARKAVSFTWRDLAGAIGSSAIVTVAAMACPVGFTCWIRPDLDFTVLEFGAVLLLAFCGWLAGVLLTRHPVLSEMLNLLRLRQWIRSGEDRSSHKAGERGFLQGTGQA